MFPVLFSIGSLSVSTFGVFLALGFLVSIFLVWRLSRTWDLNEENVLDLTLLTFVGGLLGARLFFAIKNPTIFANNIFNVLLITKTPGFSFWGAFLGGWLTLFFITRTKKMDFAQIGDIASVGFLGSLIFASLGCFFGGCGVGIPSNLFFSVEMVGFLGKRFPTQLLEALFFLAALLNIWALATHFHTRGKILSLTLIYTGVIKLLTENLKQDRDEGVYLALALIVLGVTLVYKFTKRNVVSDLKNILSYTIRLITSQTTRNLAFHTLKKYWYNKKTSFFWKIRNLKKSLRRINVRVS